MKPRIPTVVTFLALGLALAQPLAAQVGTTTAGDVTGTSVDWGTLGAPYTTVPSGASVSVGGAQMTVTTSTNQAMARRDNDPCNGWSGNFAGCDRLLWTGTTSGPMTFSFDQMISGFGTHVMADYYGPFTAEISVYRDAALVGTFRADGRSNEVNGTALFVGMLATSAQTMFNQVVLSVPTASYNPQDFAVNGPVVNTSAIGTVVTPEPMSVALIGTGLLGLAGVHLRRRRASQTA